MTKVLELFGEPFLRGGQEAFVMNVIQAIDYTNLQIDICTPYEFDSDNYKQIIESKNGKIFSFDFPFSMGGFRLNIFSPIYKFLRSNKYDVVHIHSGSVMSLAVLSIAAKLANVKKIIVHSHAAGEKENIKHIISKMLCTPILNVCPTNYFACSKEATKWKFSKKIANNKVQIIKNGIDLDKFKVDDQIRKEYRKQLDYSEDDKVIGHVGRFSGEKNHKFIIDLFAELRNKNEIYKLILLGDGELKQEIEEYSKGKGVFENIIFTGNVSNVQDYMQAMDLFILPSKFEGLGIVAIESQACGLPVIASTGVPTEAKLTDNVKFISTDNMDEWIKSVEEMITLPKCDNTKLIKSAGYDTKQMAEELTKLYLFKGALG